MFTLTIETRNAAFDDGRAWELSRILRELSESHSIHIDGSGKVFDTNGNTVGHWTLDPREGDE